jgi:thymidylate kinase
MNGKFIVIDGIAGSGKTTIIKSWKSEIEKRNISFFDQQTWTEENNLPPRLEDFEKKEALFTYEPAKYWIGSAIRNEFAFGEYSLEVQAQAFSLDRLIHYNRIIIPAIKAGKNIIQDRSITSSLVYQGMLSSEFSVEDALKLPGNILAMQYLPTDIILTKVDMSVAAERHRNRNDDKKGIFEELERLQKVQDAFHGEKFKMIFSKKNVNIHIIDTSGSEEGTIIEANKLFKQILWEN